MTTRAFFVDIIIPRSLGRHMDVLTYSVSEEIREDVKLGCLVSVPLRNRTIVGLVWKLHCDTPKYNVRDIVELKYRKPVLSAWQMKVAEWLSEYYYASLNKVIKLWVPKEMWKLTPKLPKQKMLYLINESVTDIDNFPAKTEKLRIRQMELLDSLRPGPRSLTSIKREYDIAGRKWFKDLLTEGYIKSIEEDIKPQKPDLEATKGFLKRLTHDQAEIVNKILHKKDSDKPFLLHGITGSGKTEIYLHLAFEQIILGKQVILLVPEISLTPQMQAYFSKVFGEELAIFHSRLSQTERFAEWYALWKGYKKVVIGSRSALFSPIKDLGAVIIDEEHEWTYKQDQEPRYHAREVAKRIQKETGCMLLLGSATPDIETYYHAKKGEYVLMEMNERVTSSELREMSLEMNTLETRDSKLETSKNVLLPKLPTVHIIDLRDEFHMKNMSIFSNLLKNKIREKLSKKQQIMLFLNKRGAHSAVICRDCGLVCKCPICDVTMSHHFDRASKAGKMVCHYCGSIGLPPTLCPNCKSANIRYIGVGTQRVEEEIIKLFPSARVFRADKDTTGKKDDFEKMYRNLNRGEIDILVGTQMITKGFDFPNVTLVGVILADTTLYIPDFRSSERLFQLLTQFAGRAGRGSEPGEVVIQTYTPNHPSLLATRDHDFTKYYEREIKDREELKYPPFHHIIKLTFTHPKESYCMQEIESLKRKLEEEMKYLKKDHPVYECQIYAAPAMIPRLYNKYHFHIILKSTNPDLLLQRVDLPIGFRVDKDPVQVC